MPNRCVECGAPIRSPFLTGGPAMSDKQVQLGVRIPEDLFRRIEYARRDVPRAVFVKRALEVAVTRPRRALGAARDGGASDGAAPPPAGPGQPRERGKGASRPNGGRRRASPEQAAARPVFKCRKCGFRAFSEKAVCPLHGGRLEPFEPVPDKEEP